MKVYGVEISGRIISRVAIRLAKRGEFTARDVEKDLRKYKLDDPIPLVSYCPPTIEDVYYRGADRLLQHFRRSDMVMKLERVGQQTLWGWVGKL